jgi:hypothetical protein
MTRGLLAPTLLLFFAVACDNAGTSPEPDAAVPDAMFRRGPAMVELDQSPVFQDFSEWNDRLREEGLNLQLAKYEYVTVGATGRAGRLVLASDRGSKNIGLHWVPGDPRRGGRTNLTWLIDGTEGATSSGLTQAQTDQATRDAMQTWQDVRCSDIPLAYLGATPFDVGVVQALLGMGGSYNVYADYQQVGFVPLAFFEALAPGEGEFILGVTFTFACYDNFGGPIDLDGNGLIDTCYSETYYNDFFDWAIDAPANPFGAIDVETVILHESGNGLSQDHFGDVFLDPANAFQLGGKYFFRHLHFAPYAVMNAVIWETQQGLTGSDIGGHCSIWSSWPNN